MANNPNEVLHGPLLEGAMTARTAAGDGQFAGRTVLQSGSASVTVSTAVVNSDSIIRYGSEVSSVGIGANSGGAIVVNSVISGTSFAFARATGVDVAWDETVMWEIMRTS